MRKCFGLFLLPVAAVSAMSLSLTPSAVSPAPLGTLIRFTAMANGATPGALVYRFRTRYSGLRAGRRPLDPGLQTVVDYGPDATFNWTTIEREGTYEIEASARNTSTGESAQESVMFTFSKLATGSAAVLTASAHPLVLIYSAPPCPAGGRMRVRFLSTDGAAQYTPFEECDQRFTMNFYLAGLRGNSRYTAQNTLQWGGETMASRDVAMTTGAPMFQAPPASPLSTPLPTVDGILLHGIVNSAAMATDLNGNLVWYGPGGMTFLTRANAGGTFMGIFEDGSQDPWHQFFREFDLAGVTLAQTNAGRINEQLTALGIRPITSFHHEAIRLPTHQYLVLAGSEQVLDNVQGPGPVDVLGDTILLLDRNLNVLWVWDSFEHLDASRAALLGETCTYPATVACSAFYQGKVANDWLHGNALALTPDGNLLYSIRHQDWVVKIDFRNGAGSGQVLWRLGAGGDFEIDAADSSPWFTHQHDPHFLPDGRSLAVLDNGNTRIAQNGDMGNSRGQVFVIDEAGRKATLVLNADLKSNSAALGTIQRLFDGHYHFDMGFIADPSNPAARFTQALECDSGGNIVWGMQIAAQEYRSYRMRDLYTPPEQ